MRLFLLFGVTARKELIKFVTRESCKREGINIKRKYIQKSIRFKFVLDSSEYLKASAFNSVALMLRSWISWNERKKDDEQQVEQCVKKKDTKTERKRYQKNQEKKCRIRKIPWVCQGTASHVFQTVIPHLNKSHLSNVCLFLSSLCVRSFGNVCRCGRSRWLLGKSSIMVFDVVGWR